MEKIPADGELLVYLWRRMLYLRDGRFEKLLRLQDNFHVLVGVSESSFR